MISILKSTHFVVRDFCLFAALIGLMLSGCVSVESRWQEVQQQNTVSAYKAFVQEFPETEYTPTARERIEELKFEQAKRAGTEEALQEYQREYPSGHHFEEARQLADDCCYARAAEENVLSMYEEYLRKYPYGRHVEEVRKLADTLVEVIEKEIALRNKMEALRIEEARNTWAKPWAKLGLAAVRKLDAYKINELTEEQFFQDGWDKGGVGIVDSKKSRNKTEVELGWLVGPDGVPVSPPLMKIWMDALRNSPGQVNVGIKVVPSLKDKIKKKVLCSLIFMDGILVKKLWDDSVLPFINPEQQKTEENGTTHQNRGSDDGAEVEYDQSISKYTKAIKENPEDHEAYMERGLAYEQKGETELAILDYTMAIEKVRARKRGDIYQFISTRNLLAKLFYFRGDAYLRKGEYDQAISDCTKVMEFKFNPKPSKAKQLQALGLKIDRVYFLTLINRGLAYALKRENELAILDYTKAIEMESDFLEVLNSGDKAFQENNQDYFSDKIARSTCYYGRANIFLVEGNYDQAIIDYTKAIEIYPMRADAFRMRASVYEIKGNHDQALLDYTKAIEANPRDADAFHQRAGVYFHKGNYDQTVLDCTKAIEINPRFARSYLLRAFTYSQIDRPREANDDVLRARQLDPEATEAFLKDISE